VDDTADLVHAREAFERRDWVAAFDGLVHADVRLGDDFAILGEAAYLLGRRNDCIQALQRAYATYLESGDTNAAVRSAFWLAMVLNTSGETVVGGGWVARAHRLLDEAGADTVELGYLAIHLMYQHIAAGEFGPAMERAQVVLDYGRRFNQPDLVAMGLCARGRLLLYSGDVPAGLALLDESMIGITAGEVSPIFAGSVWCALIEACQELSDFNRVAQWARALTMWCDAQPGLVPFTGQCALHRGQVRRASGAYADALAEFELAEERYRELGDLSPIGLASYERGEVLRVRGDYGAAERAFDRAAEFGYDPQPGLALLWLQRGRIGPAVGAIRRLVAEPRDPVHRAQLLPAAVHVLVEAGDLAEARGLADELSTIAQAFGCPSSVALAALGAGEVALAEGDVTGALAQLRRAIQTWSALDMPYDAACARVLVGRALLEAGDGDSATHELATARRTFVELGTTPALMAVDRLQTPTTNPAGLTDREVEVLRLAASGRSNAQIAAELVLSEKTVARHLANIFVKIDVNSRTAAAAFAFEHDLA
jgi:DNA-binding CsgD family transcriptional regulator/tetratricopeptide (TPR) repeat protein